MEFTKQELDFLKTECGVDEADLPKLTRNQWIGIREKCFDVEVEEAMEADEKNTTVSNRGEIAVQLVDYLHDVIIPMLKSKK